MRASHLLVLLVSLGACGGAPSDEDCKKMVDHMIDIIAAPRGTDKESVSYSESWKKVLKEKDPAGQALMEMCKKQMKSGHLDCVLEAKDEKALAQCLGG